VLRDVRAAFQSFDHRVGEDAVTELRPLLRERFGIRRCVDGNTSRCALRTYDGSENLSRI
ncbi:MAG TPA: hypothetical protein VFJ49_10020, partial [Methyloceanibacter sp.]|nr:hypothetical protein [Methyloceanibacter sp.]